MIVKLNDVITEIKNTITDYEFASLANIESVNSLSIYCSLSNTNREKSKLYFNQQIDLVKEKLSKESARNQLADRFIIFLENISNEEFWSEHNSNQTQEEATLVILINEFSSAVYILDKKLLNGVHLATNFYLLPLFDSPNNEEFLKDSEKIKASVFNKTITTNRIEKIIPFAINREIETLYVCSDNDVYGIYDELNESIIIDFREKLSNMSLINYAAIKTYLSGGKVFLVEPTSMPIKGVPLQAIFKQ